MRYSASEKLEIIRTVEASHLPVRQTLAMLGIPSTSYYRWYERKGIIGAARPWAGGSDDAAGPADGVASS